jgi:hypothetical protein
LYRCIEAAGGPAGAHGSAAAQKLSPIHTSAAAAAAAGGSNTEAEQEDVTGLLLDILNVHEWSAEEVGRWLSMEGFGPEVAEKFREQGIDGDVLQSLTESDMKEDLGVLRLADRRRLAEAIRQLAQYDRYAQVRDMLNMGQQPGDSGRDRGGSGGGGGGGAVKVNIPAGASIKVNTEPPGVIADHSDEDYYGGKE